MKVPASELEKRVRGFQEILRREGIEGALLSQRADTFYYSGTAQNIHLYIPQEGEALVLAFRDFNRAKEESAWQVVQLVSISKIPELIESVGYSLPKVLGLELDVLPVKNYERYRKSFTQSSLVDVANFIRLQRAVKSAWELERLAISASLHRKVLDYAKQVLRPGITEAEFEGLLEGKARALGHDGYIRMRAFGSEIHFGTITAGERAAVAGHFDGPVSGAGISLANPLGASANPINQGETIVTDMALSIDGYLIDQTRILSMGNINPELAQAHKIALIIEERLRQALVPGGVAGEIYDDIMTWVKENTPYAQNFMGFGSSRVSFVGHGVGLELDELPTISRGSKTVLSQGMVIAIEPKFIFPGLGVVGIEDTVVVEGASGARFLTTYPREIFSA